MEGQHGVAEASAWCRSSQTVMRQASVYSVIMAMNKVG